MRKMFSLQNSVDGEADDRLYKASTFQLRIRNHLSRHSSNQRRYQQRTSLQTRHGSAFLPNVLETSQSNHYTQEVVFWEDPRRAQNHNQSLQH